MKRAALLTALILTSFATFQACYNPSLNDEPFVCGGTPGNGECPEGYGCYGGLCRTEPPECWTDNYFGLIGGNDDADLEPNNIPALAYILPCGDKVNPACPNRYQEQQYGKLAICGSNDLDFYKIYLNSGEGIDFTLIYSYDVQRDLDLALWKETINGDGSVSRAIVATGKSTNDDEHISYTADQAGWYYFMVYGRTGQDVNGYALKWTIISPSDNTK